MAMSAACKFLKLQSRGIPKEGKSEADEIVKRLRTYPGVVGVIVSNREGVPIRTTLENKLTVHYCALLQGLLNKSFTVVKDFDPSNELTFLRVRSKKQEIMIAPQREFLLIVIQKA